MSLVKSKLLAHQVWVDCRPPPVGVVAQIKKEVENCARSRSMEEGKVAELHSPQEDPSQKSFIKGTVKKGEEVKGYYSSGMSGDPKVVELWSTSFKVIWVRISFG